MTKKMKAREDARIVQPLFEFGALLRYYDEHGMADRSTKAKEKFADLAKVYDKLLTILDGKEKDFFDREVDKAYKRFLASQKGPNGYA